MSQIQEKEGSAANPQRKQMHYVLAAFLVLLVISAYRQFSMDHWPADPVRQYLVYFVYMVLLVWWMGALHNRITQKNMRICLMAEAGIMMLWMTVRFLQEAFLMDHILLLRLSGYLIFVPFIWIPLLGFIAACCLGRGDEYQPDRRWYLLLLPAAALTVMSLTDPLHHFVCYIVESEPQPNIYFHLYIGAALIVVWGIGMEVARVAMIFRRNQLLEHQSLLRRCVPFLQMILMILYMIPYMLQSFYVEKELIEFSAGIFFIEALFWEICIHIGLIPVNTHHKTVFHQSTVGMQILDESGHCLSHGQNSVPVGPETFERLRSDGMVLCPEGYELWMQPIQGGYMVWQKDVSSLHRIIDQLRSSADDLREESALLSEELKTRSERAAVQEKNRIYNDLTAEVADQLSTLKNLLSKKELCIDDEAVMRRICLIGTYIKQRCNLRLIEQAEHCITAEDLNRSFQDLIRGLQDLDVRAAVRWDCAALSSPAFAIATYDLFWYLLEYENRNVRSVQGVFSDCGVFSVSVELSEQTDTLPLEVLHPHCPPELFLSGERTAAGYCVSLRERGGESEK